MIRPKAATVQPQVELPDSSVTGRGFAHRALRNGSAVGSLVAPIRDAFKLVAYPPVHGELGELYVGHYI